MPPTTIVQKYIAKG